MNRSRTLEQLEATVWPSAPSDSTPMVARCHALRKTPLAKLTAGDCRVLLNQGIGTRHVVPLALEFVEAEPLVEGDYYPGDLLVALFRLSREELLAAPGGFGRLVAVAKRAEGELLAAEEPLGSNARLQKDVNAFLAQSDA